MELIRGLTNLRPHHRGCAVTVGGFDGLHLGHQALIGRLHEAAARLRRPTMLVSFEPMPREYLAPQSPPARLTTWRERWHLLKSSGLITCCCCASARACRRLSGEEFAQLLARDLDAAAVVVGHDFKFGRGGEMSAEALAAGGERFGFAVDVVPPVHARRRAREQQRRARGLGTRRPRACAALARQALFDDRTGGAREPSGTRVGIRHRQCEAASQAHAARRHLRGARARRGYRGALPGVASLGTRPTVGGTEPLLEAHVFDFAGDLYGREIEVEFVAKLREEERFVDLAALTRQMHVDAAQARRILEC